MNASLFLELLFEVLLEQVALEEVGQLGLLVVSPAEEGGAPRAVDLCRPNARLPIGHPRRATQGRLVRYAHVPRDQAVLDCRLAREAGGHTLP